MHSGFSPRARPQSAMPTFGPASARQDRLARAEFSVHVARTQLRTHTMAVQAPGKPSLADATSAMAMRRKIGEERLHAVEDESLSDEMIARAVEAMRGAGLLGRG